MSDDLSYIRRWIKKGLSKDGKTLDFSEKKITVDMAIDLAENLSLPEVEILFFHSNNMKDKILEEFADAVK